MKRKEHRFFVLIVLGLLLWGGAALVEGPAKQAPEKAQTLPLSHPMLYQSAAIPEETTARTSAPEQTLQRFLPVREREREDEACVAVSDGNGYPIAGQTYVRTVYAAFPPEDMPG